MRFPPNDVNHDSRDPSFDNLVRPRLNRVESLSLLTFLVGVISDPGPLSLTCSIQFFVGEASESNDAFEQFSQYSWASESDSKGVTLDKYMTRMLQS